MRYPLLLLVVLAACSKLIDLHDVTYEGGDAAVPDKLASSCTELGADAIDQDVQLHLDGDATKPYPAHCSADLKTYLPLDGSAQNLSSYPLGSCDTLAGTATAAVMTTWKMVRFDPAMHAIDTGDFTFATSTGGTHETSGNGTFQWDYLQVPFGSGRSCLTPGGQLVATIDLTGTHFVIAVSQTWAHDGPTSVAQVAIAPPRTKATITVGGFPVGISPCPPLADFYTVTGGTCLQLEYAP